MQPYFFPYIGYFQLIDAVDKFVIFDDVNYIKGGWINRNYILSGKSRQLITLPLQKISQNKKITNMEITEGNKKIIKTLEHCYRKAPFYEDVMPIILGILNQETTHLVTYLHNGLREISEYLGITVEWVLSSEIDKNNKLTGQDKIIDICDNLGAKKYINLPGGKQLYDNKRFSEKNIELMFIEPGGIFYKQQNFDFVSNLSIIDIIMFNSCSNIRSFIKEYDIVRN